MFQALLNLNWKNDRLLYLISDTQTTQTKMRDFLTEHGIELLIAKDTDRPLLEHLRVGFLRQLIDAQKKLAKDRELFCLKREAFQTLGDLESFKSSKAPRYQDLFHDVKPRLGQGMQIELLNKSLRFLKPTGKWTNINNQPPVFEFECSRVVPGRFGASISSTAGPFWVDFVREPRVAYKILQINDLTKNYAASFNRLQEKFRLKMTPHESHKLDDKYYACVRETCIAVDQAVLKPADPELNDLLESFSHFCFEQSHRSLVVAVIQSYLRPRANECVILEAVVHSAGHHYGWSDLGKRGIEHLMSTHQCTGLCKAWLNNFTRLQFH